jgi:exopolysaccharide production protein ExoY
MIKRILDIILAMGGLIVTSPLFLLCMLMISLESGRPCFFIQERAGKDGKIFRLWKFRTMVVNAQHLVQSDPKYSKIYAENFKIPCSEGIVTPWGRIMRKTSLDELPQLLNVLEGDMSIVGPRPITFPEIIKKYGSYGQKLLSIKPGLTGLWQVSGRSNIGYPERIFLDMYYIDHQSLAFDLKIILRTFRALVKMEGSM